MLQALAESGEKVVDLEAIAHHCGSAFGNHNKGPQPSQEMFENRLATELLAHGHTSNSESIIWIEDESQRIGDVNIPIVLWQAMRNAPLYFLEIPFEERLDHIVQEYGDINREKLVHGISRIAKRLGPLEAKTALQLVGEENIREAFRMLLHYYDKRYFKGLHNRENLSSLLKEVRCEKVCTTNARLLNQPTVL